MAVEPRVLRLKVSTKNVSIGAALFFGGALFHIWDQELEELSIGAIVFLCGLIAGGLYNVVKAIGLSIRKPIGLRIDDNGVSGYILTFPLEWSEISGFEVIRHSENADTWAIQLSTTGVDRHKGKRKVLAFHSAGFRGYRIEYEADLLSIDATEVVRLLESHLADQQAEHLAGVSSD